VTITLANGKTTHSGQTAWTCVRVPEEGLTLRKWTVSPMDERTAKLEPQGRMGPVIFMDPAEAYATAEEAREATAKRLEGELEQVWWLGTGRTGPWCPIRG
jgi:hypothetical protein